MKITSLYVYQSRSFMCP